MASEVWKHVERFTRRDRSFSFSHIEPVLHTGVQEIRNDNGNRNRNENASNQVAVPPNNSSTVFHSVGARAKRGVTGFLEYWKRDRQPSQSAPSPPPIQRTNTLSDLRAP